MDKNPGRIVTIHGHKCIKDKHGNYYIGFTERTADALIQIDKSVNPRNPNNIRHSIFISGPDDYALGGIRCDNIQGNRMKGIWYTEIGAQGEENTIIENAINYNFDDPLVDKERQLKILEVLTMMNDLGVELTPTEKMEMLKFRKQYLQDELAKVNEQLKQKGDQNVQRS